MCAKIKVVSCLSQTNFDFPLGSPSKGISYGLQNSKIYGVQHHTAGAIVVFEFLLNAFHI